MKSMQIIQSFKNRCLARKLWAYLINDPFYVCILKRHLQIVTVQMHFGAQDAGVPDSLTGITLASSGGQRLGRSKRPDFLEIGTRQDQTAR